MPEGPSPRPVLAGATVFYAAVSFVNLGLPAVGPQLQREYGLTLAGGLIAVRLPTPVAATER